MRGSIFPYISALYDYRRQKSAFKLYNVDKQRKILPKTNSVPGKAKVKGNRIQPSRRCSFLPVSTFQAIVALASARQNYRQFCKH